MQLVILAAGHGRRFGGLKQLAPVGPHGESIMDYTARAAQRCGITGVVLVVREEIREEMTEHVRCAWPSSLSVSIIDQISIAGTAPAVLSARAEVDGAFGVANADDLYGDAAVATLRSETLAASTAAREPEHVIVAYRLANSVLTDAPVTRGICRVDGDEHLERIVEQSVRRRPDGDFDASPLGADRKVDPTAPVHTVLNGRELVSMNLWGFQPSVFDALDDAVHGRDDSAAPGTELLLPDVVAGLVASGTGRLRVVGTEARCIGLTHPDDVELVRQAIVEELDEGAISPVPGA